jgi:CMP-N-acetylneuraminic acid synthetase/ubiquinone/menaquinone biosynthesis C-methylase UbiE
MTIDAIITARSGSKGIYKKNTILVAGKPLIEYTFEAAINTPSIRHVYLSTDDTELLNKYKNHAGIKLIKRPKKLADDQASIKGVLLHALKVIGDNSPDILVLLFPTAPLRTAKDIIASLRFANSLPNFDSVVSVTRIKDSPYGGLMLDKQNKTKFLLKNANKYYRRQDQPPVYKLNGAIFIIRSERIKRLNNLLVSERSYGFEMKDIQSVDIDTPYDVVIAEAMMSFQNERVNPDSRGGFNVQRLYIYDDMEMGIRRNIFDAASYERHFRRYEFFLPYIQSSDLVLDIACGSGYGSEILASKAKFVHGIDTDPKTIEYAKRHHALSNIKFDASQAESFTPPKERYDKVISVETIEHLADPDSFLARAKGWLKPEGELWLTCPLSQGKAQHIESPFHISELTRGKLNDIMNRYFGDISFFELNDGELFAVDTLKNRVAYIVARGTNK